MESLISAFDSVESSTTGASATNMAVCYRVILFVCTSFGGSVSGVAASAAWMLRVDFGASCGSLRMLSERLGALLIARLRAGDPAGLGQNAM